jgi:DNA-binding transcriptional regulator YiaG
MDIMSAYEEKFLKEYKMKVGAKTYVFQNVKLEKSPIGKWVITYGKIQEMMKSVAAKILADKDQALTFDELEHLADTAELSMAKIAEMIKVDRSTITKWKKGDGIVPYTESYCLKDKLPQLIFEFDDRLETAQHRVSYWLEKGRLPYPKDVA